MPDSPHERLQRLFDDLVELPPDRQAEALEQLRPQDRQLHDELLALLNTTDSLLDRLAPSLTSGVEFVARSNSEELPETLGPFRILSRLGEGGAGVVYEALQPSPERRVALKVMRALSPSPDARRRFAHEADIVARLSHPHIAQVYQAGVLDTDLGPRPYLAIELVDGQPITTHARTLALDINLRVELFTYVCDAVQHAHQRAVIHRDLKPSNILVDRAAGPKVLDFGIARINDDDTDAVHTRTGAVLGTTAYMSPDRLRAEPADARDDVYSLAATLFEILADQPAFDPRAQTSLASTRAGREQPPPSLARANPLCRGDLDTIVRKGMDPDRARRYQSASELVADLRRWLAHEPVAARPASALYTLRKLARRNQAASLAILVSLLALIAALVVSAAMFRRSETARRHESLARERADAVASFLISIADATDLENQGLNLRVVDALNQKAPAIDEKFLDNPPVRAQLHNAVGRMYQNLGDTSKANEHLAIGAPLLAQSLAPTEPDAVDAAVALAYSHADLGQWDVALEKLQSLLPDVISALPPSNDARIRAEIALADALQVNGHYDKAEPILRDVLERTESDPRLVSVNLAALNVFNAVLRSTSRADEAIETNRRELELCRTVRGPRHPQTIAAAHNFGALLYAAGRAQEAADLFEQNLDVGLAVFPDDHWRIAYMRRQLGIALVATDQPARAIEQLDLALNIFLAQFEAKHWECMLTREYKAIALLADHRAEDALELLRDEAAQRQNEPSVGSGATASVFAWIARAHLDLAQPEQALEASARAVDFLSESPEPRQRDITSVWIARARALAATGAADEGRDALRRAQVASPKPPTLLIREYERAERELNAPPANNPNGADRDRTGNP